MNRRLMACLMVAIGAGLVGCNGQTEEPPAPETATPQEQSQAPDPATPPPQTESRARPMESVAPPPPDTEDRTTASPARETTASPTDQPPAQPRQRRATQTPPPQQQPAQPDGPAAPAAGTPEAKARALMEQLRTQIQASKWAEGEKTLKQLQGLRNQVPADMRTEIDNEMASFKAAKLITEGL